MKLPDRLVVIATSLLGFILTGCGAGHDDLVPDARACMEAFLKKNYLEMTRYMLPEAIKQAGSREAVAEKLKQMMGGMLYRAGAEPKSVKLGEPSRIFTERGDRVAVIPYVMELGGGIHKDVIESYLLAILKPGAPNWAFLDGTSLPAKTVSELYPEFALRVDIPTVRSSAEERLRESLATAKTKEGVPLTQEVAKLRLHARRVIFALKHRGSVYSIESKYSKPLDEHPSPRA